MGSNRSSQLPGDVRSLFASLGPLPPPVAKPVFIVLSGLPGTGKSYFSKRLAERLPLVILESDALRKVLFPGPTYSWRESVRLFRAIHLLVEKLLLTGVSLILDATNLAERYRKELYDIAGRVKVELILVKLEAPVELVRERLEARTKESSGWSDADWEVYQMMKPREERIRHKHYVVDTSQDITPVINEIVRESKQ